jgi:hypothetical protein
MITPLFWPNCRAEDVSEEEQPVRPALPHNQAGSRAQ